MNIDKKIKEILKLMKEYKPSQDYFKVMVSVYACEMVVNLQPFDWEFYGDTLELALDEAIQDLEESIRDKEEEEREARAERDYEDTVYWDIQGAKTGFVKSF